MLNRSGTVHPRSEETQNSGEKQLKSFIFLNNSHSFEFVEDLRVVYIDPLLHGFFAEGHKPAKKNSVDNDQTMNHFYSILLVLYDIVYAGTWDVSYTYIRYMCIIYA